MNPKNPKNPIIHSLFFYILFTPFLLTLLVFKQHIKGDDYHDNQQNDEVPVFEVPGS